MGFSEDSFILQVLAISHFEPAAPAQDVDADAINTAVVSGLLVSFLLKNQPAAVRSKGFRG